MTFFPKINGTEFSLDEGVKTKELYQEIVDTLEIKFYFVSIFLNDVRVTLVSRLFSRHIRMTFLFNYF